MITSKKDLSGVKVDAIILYEEVCTHFITI